MPNTGVSGNHPGTCAPHHCLGSCNTAKPEDLSDSSWDPDVVIQNTEKQQITLWH